MIRYKLNIMEELKKVGYSTYRLRNEKKLSESTMQKLRAGNTTISVASLNDVCHLLQCQPGDLLEFIPDDPDELKKEPTARADENISETLKQITVRLDKMEIRLDDIKEHLNP